MADGTRDLTSAVHDFWRARRRANVREALSFLRGSRDELLSYDDVRRQLRAVEESSSRLEDVPLDSIVGSVGRYNDFTRGFLPRQDSDKERWAGVRQAMTGLEGVPPIEVYRIGDAYFVKDGNHRVSVARQLGAKYLQAYVTTVRSRVKLEADVEPDDLIIKAEHANFLLETRLDELRPEADFTVTVPGQYETLREHISVHRYFMGIDQERPIPYPEAVAHWYDTVYLPVVESIRYNGLLRGFPGRTECDLYIWLSQHRGILEEELGWSLPTEAIAHGVAGEVSGERRQLTRKRREHAMRAALGQEPALERICADILVALPHGREDALQALEQALLVARREGSRLYGLHVQEVNSSAAGGTSAGQSMDGSQEPGGEAAALGTLFEERCRAAGVPSQFAVAQGRPRERLLERATWSDLVVTTLPHDDVGQVNLSGGYRSFLRRSPRPVLTVCGPAAPIERALLAYDGGSRAHAALFVTAYIAAKWGTPVVVLTVGELGQGGGSPLEEARAYLESYGIRATYVAARGRVGSTIVEAAAAHGCDTVLMGSYKYSPWLESMLGGVLEEVLRRFRGAVLVA
jgi:nucleotide-binding universal stress UspA family protein